MEKGMIPPQNIELEQRILGALMADANCVDEAMETLVPDYFYKEDHKLVFKAMVWLYERRSPIDFLSVVEALKKSGELELAGGNYAVTLLSSKASSGANMEFDSRVIMESFFKREIIRICSESLKDAYDETTDAFEIIERTGKVYDVVSSQVGRSVHKIGKLVIDRFKAYEVPAIDGITGVPSGFTDLDRETGGWQDTDLIIVGGRPAMGKTAFVLSAARNAAVDHNKPVLIFSLEMSAVQLTDRLVSGETEIEAEIIRKRRLTDWHWQSMHSKIGSLMDAPLFIDDTPGINLLQIATKAKKLKKEEDIGMVIIDYLQLIRIGFGKTGNSNREQDIGTISRSLKILAKELGVPVMALSQLSRNVENRPGPMGKRPLLSDLRESGSIEQDADMVLFLFRPEYYGLTEDEHGRSLAGLAEVIIAKNRNGETTTVPLRFIGKYTKFANIEEQLPSNQLSIETAIKPSTEFDRPTENIIIRPSRMDDIDDDDEYPF